MTEETIGRDERIVLEMDPEALPPSRPSNAEEQISLAQLRKNRAAVTILHFILTYPKFSISLFVLFASVTTPLPTSYERIRQPMTNLQFVVDREARLYHQCVVEGFALHRSRMERVVEAEKKRAEDHHVHFLQPLIAKAAQATSGCFNATLASQRAVQAWNTLGQAVPRTYDSITLPSSNCTAHDQELLSKLLSEDANLAHTQVQNIYEAYSNASLASMRNLVRYAHDRGEYDYNYFIGAKLPMMFMTIDQFPAPNIVLTWPDEDLIAELRDLLTGLLDALRTAYQQVNVLTKHLGNYETSLRGFNVSYFDLYQRFERAGAFVRELLPHGAPIPPLFDMSDFSAPENMLPKVFPVPGLPALPLFHLLEAEYLEGLNRILSQFLQKAAENASTQARQVIQQLQSQLEEFRLMEDYDPPQYTSSQEGIQSPEDELSHLESFAHKTNEEVDRVMDALKRRNDDVVTYKPTSPNVEVVVPPTLDEGDETLFPFLKVSYPKYTAPVWMMFIFGFLCSQTFLIECVTQAIRLYRLKKKYETNATPDLPEIDYVGDDDEDKQREQEEGPSKIQVAQAMFIKHVMNPWVICGLSIVPLIVVILFCWFPHIKRSCIDSRSGTFLARNILTQMQVNRANSQGYSVHVAAQRNCYSRQRVLCDTVSSEADAAYRYDVAKIVSLQSSLNESNSARGVLSRCVDVELLDAQFEANCCGLEGYTATSAGKCPLDQQWHFCPIDGMPTPPSSFRPVGESLGHPACTFDMDSLKVNHAQFNCSVLQETCHTVPCTGVDANLIEEMTVEADCSAQTFAIQLCVFIAITVFHAVMINWVNTLMFNGILQVRWQSLKPDGIKMITHVNSNGDLVKGADAQERTDRVRHAMKRYVWAGYVQVGLGFIVFVVWLTALFLLRRATARLSAYHR